MTATPPRPSPPRNEPQIRLFMVMRQLSLQPLGTFAKPLPDHLEGQWRVCTPAVLGGNWGWMGFSALAYYFGREIHHHFNRPVGLIQSAWGGTQVAGWTSISGLEKNPIMAHYVADHQKRVDNFAQATIDYPQQRAAGAVAFKAWNDQYGIPFQKEMTQWNLDSAKAIAAGQTAPPKPRLAVPKPPGISPPDGWIYGAGNLFNGMVNPVIPYGIKGVIWLQGEQDRGNAFEYFTSFPGLIADWREKWGEGDFPFLYVQLSNGNPPNPKRPIEELHRHLARSPGQDPLRAQHRHGRRHRYRQLPRHPLQGQARRGIAPRARRPARRLRGKRPGRLRPHVRFHDRGGQ